MSIICGPLRDSQNRVLSRYWLCEMACVVVISMSYLLCGAQIYGASETLPIPESGCSGYLPARQLGTEITPGLALPESHYAEYRYLLKDVASRSGRTSAELKSLPQLYAIGKLRTDYPSLPS